MVGYWNHDTAYHAELLAAVPPLGGDVLEIGCGDAFVVEKLATKATNVIGLDPDPCAIDQARRRLSETPNAQVVLGSFLTAPELNGRSSSRGVACASWGCRRTRLPGTGSPPRARD